MIGGKTRKIAGIAVVALAVGGGAYLTGAKALGACDAKAKASKAALTSNGAMTCEKVHASAMASKNGTDAKAQTVALTSTNAKADDCCESKTTTAAVVSKNGSCDAKASSAAMTSNGTCEAKTSSAAMTSNGTCEAKAKNAVMTDAGECPMKTQATKTAAVSEKAGDCSKGSCDAEKGVKTTGKDGAKKAQAKGAMASVVPAEATTK